MKNKGGEAGKKNKKILGCVENALGLPEWIKENKLQDRLKLVITSDKQGENSVAEKTLPEASVVISQPFWPCYLDQKRIDKAKHLKLAITAGVGSDHVNLEAACKRGKRKLNKNFIYLFYVNRNYYWYVSWYMFDKSYFV